MKILAVFAVVFAGMIGVGMVSQVKPSKADPAPVVKRSTSASELFQALSTTPGAADHMRLTVHRLVLRGDLTAEDETKFNALMDRLGKGNFQPSEENRKEIAAL